MHHFPSLKAEVLHDRLRPEKIYIIVKECVGSSVDRASDFGSEGRGFESFPTRSTKGLKKI